VPISQIKNKKIATALQKVPTFVLGGASEGGVGGGFMKPGVEDVSISAFRFSSRRPWKFT
jgi:hypothetical protein